MTIRSVLFHVELWPRAEAVELRASDIIVAAELAREHLGPSNDAHVWRVGGVEQYGDPDTAGCGVVFDDRPCCVHFVGFREEKGSEYNNARRLWGSPDFFHRKWDQRAQREIAPYDVIVFARGSEHEEPSRHNVDDSNEPRDPAAEERKVLSRDLSILQKRHVAAQARNAISQRCAANRSVARSYPAEGVERQQRSEQYPILLPTL